MYIPKLSGAVKTGAWRAFSAAAVLGLLGCDTVPTDKFLEVQRESQAAKEQVARLEDQLAEEQQTVRNLQKQLANVRGMDQNVLGELVTPVKIRLAPQSGGYQVDEKPGDAGVVLYIQPVDKDGDVIKAAGSIQVTLLDLTNPSSPVVVATYSFDVATTSKMWYGRFMTDHYTVRCPWPPSGPPATDEITARVEFTVLLTGRVLIAQERFPIKRPPVLAATRPE